MSDVLYVHPFNHARPDAIPVGSVAAINRLTHPTVGRYCEELEADEVRAAKVLLLDVHWFFPLAVLSDLTSALRRVNPSAPIVIGGITASFYGGALFERAPVDYIVAGDAEPCLPSLVDHLVAGEAPPPLPNVWRRGFGRPEKAVTGAG